MYLNEQIDCIAHFEEGKFRKDYLEAQKPVIIKGFGKTTPAGKKWSIDYFKNTMGDILIDVFDNGNKKSASSAFTKPDLKMKFRDYLDIISKKEHTDLRIFLFNLFKFNPRLKEEFPCPSFFKGILSGMGYMFFGGKDTTVRIHQDIDMSHVLHTHFGGRKRVVLIAPEYSELLYRLPLNTYSLINLDKPDYKHYPALHYVRGSEAILEDGDSLFMPAGYWHYMTYLEGSFSVSYRKLGRPGQALKGMVSLLVYMPVDKLLNKIFGKNWLDTKMRIAQRRANKLIARMNSFEEILGI